MTNKKIGVVLVTFNRLAKLKKALQCYALQDSLPSYLIVVDNASTDGTEGFLQEWNAIDEQFEKIVIRLQHNIGGSGGFYEGLRVASEKDSDWIWVADDDAYPEKSCFSIAMDYISTHSINDVSAICGSVLFDGHFCLKHRRRTYVKKFNFFSIPVSECEYKTIFAINTYSFVGSILCKDKLQKVGLPRKDYFIWCDDSEHSLRMSKVGKIICIPQMQVNHDECADNKVVSWKLYYGLRNQLDMVRIHFPKYFVFMWIKFVLLGIIFFFENREKGILYLTATKDALFNNFGLHKKYRPGWKIGNKNA